MAICYLLAIHQKQLLATTDCARNSRRSGADSCHSTCYSQSRRGRALGDQSSTTRANGGTFTISTRCAISLYQHLSQECSEGVRFKWNGEIWTK